ncbi:L-serine dehydratase, beta subunit (EC / L-serine dehydratase, alpha subunit (EC [Olavius algarvensis Delta 1 endosymbiont]|nr:L-serine dehydratase, beta subunit (EC / L-serine dehydratase, alpha subunit (EC [Olavius algarvensis Delta 1 endosymbiont]
MPDYITTSIFDIFKSGPGPSSSHTIGPMKAALSFRETVRKSLEHSSDFTRTTIDVYLYGSLSLTGEGHGTPKAVLGGLLGWAPESCDCDHLLELLDNPATVYELPFETGTISFKAANIHFEGADPLLPYQNTLRFKLTVGDQFLLEREYYSIGGGFIQCRGETEPERPQPPYPYRNMNELRKILRKSGLSLREVMLQNEESLTGQPQATILNGIDGLIDAMCRSVETGLATDGLLPGPIGLMRKAPVLFKNSERMKRETGRSLALLNAYAHAASEENAAGRRIVTAPTSGSAGVLPGVIYLMKQHFEYTAEQFRDGMLAAAAIAFIAKQNASIAGAEVGCQGEIGVASSMAAALIANAGGLPMKQVENAAEIALEHQLGTTCDPVGGYVQIPCIERNAVGAVQALNAFILAEAGDPARQKVTFDEVVDAMMETGRDMCTKYKETSKGGLAVCCVAC